jgi:MFS family permease
LGATLAEFVSARAGLAGWEARAAARQAARKGAKAGAMLAALGFTWALLLAGGLGWAAAAGLPWHWIAIGTGLLHLLVALILAILLALPSPPAFPLTRHELEQDRAWLEQLKQDLKSRN